MVAVKKFSARSARELIPSRSTLRSAPLRSAPLHPIFGRSPLFSAPLTLLSHALAVTEMATQCYTTRIVKRLGWVSFGENYEKSALSGHE